MSMTTSASDRAQQVAGTAATEGQHVAGTAKDEAAKVASEAKGQAKNLFSEATTQVDQQSRMQKDRLAETLRSFSDDLDAMAGDHSGLAADLTQQVAERARGLSTQLGSKDPQDLLQDVRGFARRKPGLFLLGSLAAGVVAGRLLRGAQGAQSPTSADGAAVSNGSPYYDGGSPTSQTAPPVGTTFAGSSAPGTAAGYSAPPSVEQTPPAAPWADGSAEDGDLPQTLDPGRTTSPIPPGGHP
jgi:hypothetical protein